MRGTKEKKAEMLPIGDIQKAAHVILQEDTCHQEKEPEDIL